MAQDGTFHAAEVADRGSPPAPNDTNIPHPDAANRQQRANKPSIVDTLFAPALAPGDKVEDFQALVAEVSAALQPHTLLERLEVNDLCQALWEEQRFRRQQAALPVATCVKALACLLMSNGFQEDTLFDIATGYFCEDGDEPTQAAGLLRRFNITDDAIYAQASQLNLPTLSMLEHLMANRQSRRDVIVSEYRRRQRKAEKLADRKSVGEPLSDQPARH